MTRLEKMTIARAAHVASMRAFCDAEENADWGDAQNTAYEPMKAELTRMDAEIVREEELRDAERREPAIAIISDGDGPVVRNVRNRADSDPARGFPSHQDFLLSVIDNAGYRDRSLVADERLRPLAVVDESDRSAGGDLTYMLPVAFTPPGLVLPPAGAVRAAAGSDEHGVYDDRYGGALVTPTFLPGMLKLGFEGDPTVGRTQPVPMQSPVVSILARTDKNHTSSVSGGLTVGRRAETVAATASRMEMERIILNAHSLFGMSFATEELMADSPISFVAILSAGFNDQFAHEMLREKLRGTGGDQYLGVLTALAASSLGPTLSVSRNTASQVHGIDAVTMRSRCWGYGNAIWIANHDTYPWIARAALFDVGATPVSSVSIYQPSIREDRPDMLLGRPIFYSEYASTLNTAGDLILANFSQFLDGLYQPLQSAESVHVRFLNHERAFKFWLRNAGAPWWRTALTPNQSSTTLSPFIILGA